MKKKIISVAVAIAAIFAVSANAQRPQCAPQQCPSQGCSQPGQCQSPRRDAPNPFEGINLTAEQQTAINNIQQQCSREGQRCDSAARAQRRQARRESRRDYLNQIKSVLTPEQYVTFLENLALQQPQRQHGQHMQRGRQQQQGHERQHRRR